MQYDLFASDEMAPDSRWGAAPETGGNQPVSNERGLAHQSPEWPSYEAWLAFPLATILALWYEESARIEAPLQPMIDKWTDALRSHTGRDKNNLDRRKRCKNQIRHYSDAQQRMLQTFRDYYVGGMTYVQQQLCDRLQAQDPNGVVDTDWVDEQLTALFHHPDPVEEACTLGELVIELSAVATT